MGRRSSGGGPTLRTSEFPEARGHWPVTALGTTIGVLAGSSTHPANCGFGGVESALARNDGLVYHPPCVPHLVLIVEDNTILLKGMMALLRPHGHAVLGAATVAEARAHLAEAEPSHAILDLNLPDGTGVDVLGEIRSRGWCTGVLIVSGWHDGELVDRAKSLGVDGVLLKPPDWEQIVRWAGMPPESPIGSGEQT